MLPIMSTKRGIGTVGARCSGLWGSVVDCEGEVEEMSLDESFMSSISSSDAMVTLVLVVTCVLGEEFPVRVVSRESEDEE